MTAHRGVLITISAVRIARCTARHDASARVGERVQAGAIDDLHMVAVGKLHDPGARASRAAVRLRVSCVSPR